MGSGGDGRRVHWRGVAFGRSPFLYTVGIALLLTLKLLPLLAGQPPVSGKGRKEEEGRQEERRKGGGGGGSRDMFLLSSVFIQ